MNRSRRQVLAGAGSAALLAALPGTARGGGIRVVGGPAFGSYWRLTLPRDAGPEQPARELRREIEMVDGLMSPYRPDSEISRFNRFDGIGWLPVSAPTRSVIAAGLEAARRTHGAFDPTVGPLVNRLGFGPITGAGSTGYGGIRIGAEAVGKLRPGLTFDPCGIAKGYALDRIVRRLDGLGLADYLVELGGEVFARGGHPSGRPWSVGVERPRPGGAPFQRIVRLNGAALATSGDYANGFELSGRRFSHVIDPEKAAPVDNAVASVSVIAPSAMMADALATALMAMGPERGIAFARGRNLPVLFILYGEGRLRELATPAFAARILA